MSTNVPLLVGETFSPWTKKARWALEHCGVQFEYEEYVPTLSEPKLRWRLKQFGGSVSVPVLLTKSKALRGSFAIAQYANRQSPIPRLGCFDAIAEWDRLSEAALAEGRARVLRSVLDSNRALEEALPAFFPLALRPATRLLARDTVRRLEAKYRHLVRPGALREALSKTRQGLSEGSRANLLEEFSYADITMATVLEVIKPIAREDPPLGPVNKSFWFDESLADEFQDLVEWRDGLARGPTTSFSQFAHFK